jgi:hypothetical protein
LIIGETGRTGIRFGKIWSKVRIFFGDKSYLKLVRVLFRPILENELPDMSVKQFFISMRFDQRGKMDQLGIEMGTFE